MQQDYKTLIIYVLTLFVVVLLIILKKQQAHLSELENEVISDEEVELVLDSLDKEPIKEDVSKEAVISMRGVIALIIDDFGYRNDEVSDGFLKLDASMTYAIIPGHTYSSLFGKKAVDAGFEVIVHMPLENTGKTFGEAYIKSQYAAGIHIPENGKVFISVREPDKNNKLIELGKFLVDQNFEIIATTGTADYLTANNINCKQINKVREGTPHIVELIKAKEVELIINTTEGKQSIQESFSIRAEAVISGITYYTSLEAAHATMSSFNFLGDISVNRLQDYNTNNG